jgi:hypothetical protein
MDQENSCHYVCSRGILKSCDIYSHRPISSIRQLINYDFSNVTDGSVIYICGSAIPYFIMYLSDTMPCKYILVSGDCDETIPNDVFNSEQEFLTFLNSPKLIHWFSQNCIYTTNSKLSQIPIGLDYHTLSEKNHEWGFQKSPSEQENELQSVIRKSKPFWERECKAYANFHFFVDSKYGFDRKHAITQIPQNCVYYEPYKTKRLYSWTNQSHYSFVISPHGNGLDCHRTWEAFVLGCIPIVKTSPLDSLLEGLPVLIVKEWSDITMELLHRTVEEFQGKQFKKEKLYLNYWVDFIQSKKK